MATGNSLPVTPYPQYEKVAEGIKSTTKTAVDLIIGFLPEQKDLDFAMDGFSTAPIQNKIMITHIAPSVTLDELRGLFEPFGEIQDIRVIKNVITGERKGYGFIEFVEENAAVDSLIVHGRRLHGKDLKVLPARPQMQDGRRANLHIAGLDASWTVHDLFNFFKYQGQVVEVKILLDEAGLCKGVGFVRFATHSQADFVRRQWNGKTPEGEQNPIQLNFTRPGKLEPSSSAPSSGHGTPNSSAPGSPLPGNGQHFGFHQAAETGSGLSEPVGVAVGLNAGPTEVAIFVGNLDGSFSTEMLKAEFQKHGNVLSVVMMMIGSIAHPGYAFVNMADAFGAVNAIRKLHRYPQASGKRWLVQLKTDSV